MGARVAGVLSVPRGKLYVAATEQIFELPTDERERRLQLDGEPDTSIAAVPIDDERPGYVPRQRKLVMLKKRA